MSDAADPLQPHTHDPNPDPPSADPSFQLAIGRTNHHLTVADLRKLPARTVSNCYIVSTGHGTSGPFAFTGVELLELLDCYAKEIMPHLASVSVVSGDGFGTRFNLEELRGESAERPPLLAYALDGRPMTREEGLVRLIVPTERDDALRQVKWIARIEVV